MYGWLYILKKILTRQSASQVSISLKKLQLDVGSEPYLSTAKALCLFISNTFYYKSFENWQRISKVSSSSEMQLDIGNEIPKNP